MTDQPVTALTGGLVLRRATGAWRAEDLTVLLRGGRVEELRAAGAPVPAAARKLDVSGRLVIPGFINAHYHSADHLFRARLPKGPLEVWVASWRALRRATADDVGAAVRWAAVELLQTGITTVLDHFAPATDVELVLRAFGAYEEAGIRATLAPLVGDRDYGDVPPLSAEADSGDEDERARFLATLRRIMDEARAQGHSIMVGPAAPQRCSGPLLRDLRELAEEWGVGIHLHCLESPLHPATAAALWGKSTVEHLADQRVLGQNASLAHCVWLQEGEVELLAQSGTVVAHNPVSNWWLGSGVAPIRKLLDAGVSVALGSDGAEASGPADMFGVLRAALISSRLTTEPGGWLAPQEALDMMWRGGAAALQDPNLGHLEPGAHADLVILDLEHPAFRPRVDVVEQLVWYADRSAIESVFTRGVETLRDGRPREVDAHRALEELERACANVAVPEEGQTDERYRRHVLDAYRQQLNNQGVLA